MGMRWVQIAVQFILPIKHIYSQYKPDKESMKPSRSGDISLLVFYF